MSKSMFLAGFVCGFIALVFTVISFSSPYWLQSYPSVHSEFVRLGLWEICFDGYVHPLDSNSKAYQGCWWVFSSEFNPIWQWLTPDWFISVQVLITLAFLLQMVNIGIASMNLLKCCSPEMGFTINLVCSLMSIGSGVLYGIGVLVFGVKSEKREWMPRPDQNFLSWSFGFAILSGFFSTFAGLFLLAAAKDVITKKRKAKKDPHAYPIAPRL
ncbi:uncharacterized protein LOC135503067 [Lineus longissimus]|uniref:uncharacterized protein LOC135503067 n=1 Tax=Lineus longissimus TaxID=88925 RepID=UPI002B4F0BF3